ncbi:MAG: endosialidase [Lachnospiraceae bacterium]|nr:endosialidase [Lachnospiraceae bacterium]
MAVISELIRIEEDGTLSFGDYTLPKKTKKGDFAYNGASYKIKTFKEITKLERDGMFVYESVPGTAVEHLQRSEDEVSFSVEGANDAEFTLELEPQTEYDLFIDGKKSGTYKTNLGGKLSVGVELDEGTPVKVDVKKV